MTVPATWPRGLRPLCAPLVGLLLAGCAASPAGLRDEGPPSITTLALQVPEGASGWTPKPGWTASRFMVAAANPLATEAGYRTLRAGGSAVDAAIAVQAVLGLVEPQSSGIGGGAFLMHWDGREIAAWDGRETAPAAAHERLFLDAAGKPPPPGEATFGGRAVATPGAMAMLEAAHRAHGRMPWARLFDDAIALAEGGFAVSPRLHAMTTGSPDLQRDPLARAYFLAPDGRPWPVGHVLRNPAYAAVLRALAAQGSRALSSGPIAADLVARVRGHAVPGPLTLADLDAYRPLRREALCTLWRATWRICGFPPPSSGHLTVMQILGLLEQMPGGAGALESGLPGAEPLHRYTEAARLAYADRALYIADPAFVAAPGGDWRRLLDGDYLRQRAALVGPRRMPTAPPGQPAPSPTAFAPMPEQPEHGTSHVSVVDAEGRAVAMTTTIETAFGARVMTDGGTGLPGGYLLNNEMTDFALEPADAQGRPVANRIEPGKRPRSSMSPTLVFDARDGRFVMSLGSPGGPVIIHFVAKTLLGTLAWGLDAQRAIDLPNFGSLGGPLVLERGLFPPATAARLRALGHEVAEWELTSGLQAIRRTAQGWEGGADPRREGVVRGD